MTGGEAFHQHGKHRPGSGSWIPLPEPGHHHVHTKAVLAPPGIVVTEPHPIEPTEIVITTVPITGLRTFDLGTVPASVTPPRTWRKAAWFAVAASVGVLIALAGAATAFVSRPSQWSTIDALPSLPGATETITTLPAGSESRSPSRTSTVNGSAESPSIAAPDRIRTDSNGEQGSTAADQRVPTAPTGSITTSADPGSSSLPTLDPVEPQRSTVTPLVLATPVNADQIGDRTETYYANVVEDPQAAYAMTSGPMQDEGPDGIKRRYQDVADVQVEKITIDPGSGRTTNTVRLQHRDGSVITQRRVLTFSAGDDPRITNETTG